MGREGGGGECSTPRGGENTGVTGGALGETERTHTKGLIPHTRTRAHTRCMLADEAEYSAGSPGPLPLNIPLPLTSCALLQTEFKKERELQKGDTHTHTPTPTRLQTEFEKERDKHLQRNQEMLQVRGCVCMKMGGRTCLDQCPCCQVRNQEDVLQVLSMWVSGKGGP